MKQAVILAAGMGSRLNGEANGMPKCLVRVGDRPLIEHQLRVLHGMGLKKVCLVLGHCAETVRTQVNHGCEFVENPRFAETNSLYSLWAVRKWVRGPFLLLNCDVLAHPDVYHRVLAVNGTALAYDSSSGDDPEHMKVALDGPLVTALGKDLPARRTRGENVGVIQFDGSAVGPLFEEVERLVNDGGERHWAPAAVDRLARRLPVRAIDVADLPWTEIDFPEDLTSARRAVWPLIRSGRWTNPAAAVDSLHVS